jgi:hypothetical protein
MSFSLCNLRGLCASVVDNAEAKDHHRGTETTEVAQRVTSKLGHHRPLSEIGKVAHDA